MIETKENVYIEKRFTGTLQVIAIFIALLFLCNFSTRIVIRYTASRGLIKPARTLSKIPVAIGGIPVPAVIRGILDDIVETVHLFVMKFLIWSEATAQFGLLQEYDGWNSSVKENNSRNTVTATLIDSKEVYFLRHGQSVWNLIFNVSKIPMMIVRIITTFLVEVFLFCSLDSLIIDSPLSNDGIAQCNELSDWVDGSLNAVHSRGPDSGREELKSLLRGDKEAIIVTSNLRRTLSTLIFSMGKNLRSKVRPKVYMLSDLQEATRNVDSFSLAPPNSVQTPSVMEKVSSPFDMNQTYSTIDAVYNQGNKSIKSTLLKRQCGFLDWVFHSRASQAAPHLPFIVCCHSLYVRNLFKRIVKGDHISKVNKISNCGVVKCIVNKYRDTDNVIFYSISPESIVPLYKGFA